VGSVDAWQLAIAEAQHPESPARPGQRLRWPWRTGPSLGAPKRQRRTQRRLPAHSALGYRLGESGCPLRPPGVRQRSVGGAVLVAASSNKLFRPETRAVGRLRRTVVTWLILPVVICLFQRLSHACLSISNYTAKLRMAH
jgi:hypothetical protein